LAFNAKCHNNKWRSLTEIIFVKCFFCCCRLRRVYKEGDEADAESAVYTNEEDGGGHEAT